MTGFVTLLGAGPGDEDLLTVKGLRRLKEADVLVYDRLINDSLFRLLKPSCEKINVGKQPDNHRVTQKEIEAILVEQAKLGKKVVRLKSGDPYIFGRGGEEGVTLAANNVAFEVVPGISSAVAALTYAGVPITYRDIATSFHVITAHLQDETEQLNWASIAGLKGTLVFLMGMSNLPTICSELVKNGHDKNTPVVIVEWGTHPQQRSIDGTLETIVELAQAQQFGAPSIIAVGEVVAFRKQLNFHENNALQGKRILVQETTTGKLPGQLKDEGAVLVQFPARTKVVEKAFELPELSDISGIVVTDMDSWQIFLNKVIASGKDIRDLHAVPFLSVGHHVRTYMTQAGYQLAQSTVSIDNEAFQEYVRAQSGQWLVLTDALKADKMAVLGQNVVVTHEKEIAVNLDNYQFERVDAICLPNSVAAETLVYLTETLGLEHLKTLPVILMGAVTSAVMSEAGFNHQIVSTDATIRSLVETCVQTLS